MEGHAPTDKTLSKPIDPPSSDLFPIHPSRTQIIVRRSNAPPSPIPTRLEMSQQSLTMLGRVHRFLTDGEKSLCKMEQTSIC